MNQLIMIGALVGIAVIGMAFIIGTATNPGETITSKVVGDNSKALSLPPVIDGKQDIFLKATQSGTYSPNYLIVKKGIPVRIHYSADQYVGCGRQVIFPTFNVQQLAPSSGEAIIEFTPQTTGTFPFNCPMRMVRGTIEVVA